MKLPNGWKEEKLGDIVEISSGGTPSKENTLYWGNEYPWISAKDMKIPIVTDSIDKLSKEGYKVANIAKQGSLLILIRGMTLHHDVPVCVAGCDVAFNQDVKCLSINNDVDVIYLLMYLKAKKSKLLELVDSAGNGTGRLDTDLLKNMTITFPQMSEQKEIAKTLSVWDKMIEKVEQIIMNQEHLFINLMSKCFNSFESSYTFLLADLSEITKGNQLGKIDMIQDGTIPVINGGIEKSGYTNKSNREKNTITISEGGNSCGFVNFINESFWAGGHCYTVIPNNSIIQNRYLYWFLKWKQEQLMKLRVGSGLPNIQSKDLEKVQVDIYSIDEQKIICEVLDTAKKEIETNRELLEQYKLQKQGLMQKLLTGQWRIK